MPRLPLLRGRRDSGLPLSLVAALALGGCQEWGEDPTGGTSGSDDDSAQADDDTTAPSDDDSTAPPDDDTTPPDDDSTPPPDDDTTPPADDDSTPTGTDADGDGFFAETDDCDDSDPDVHPGVDEVCDSVDNDCNGGIDEGWDDDGDGVVDCADDCPTYVNAAASAPFEGTLTNPFAAVQEGLDHAVAAGCPLVLVAQGIYYENVDFGGWAVRVESISGPAVTTIDGGAAGPVVTFASGEGPDAQIVGFTLTGGAAEAGAGIYVEGASPVIEANEIVANQATGYAQGGGIFVRDGAPSILDNLIASNDAGHGGGEDGNDGGAIFARSSTCLIQGNRILFNSAGDGGGIWLAGSYDHIVHNVIYGNVAMDVDPDQGGQGGGIEVHNSVSLAIENNVVAANEASAFGGGIAFYEATVAEDPATPSLAHNVVAWNTCAGQGAGVLVRSNNAPDIRGNAIWQNEGAGGIYGDQGVDLAVVAYNDLYQNGGGDYAGTVADRTGLDGNLSLDPRFVHADDDGDPADDDWHLLGASPLRNAGDPDPAWNDPDGTRADIGVYGGPDGSW